MQRERAQRKDGAADFYCCRPAEAAKHEQTPHGRWRRGEVQQLKFASRLAAEHATAGMKGRRPAGTPKKTKNKIATLCSNTSLSFKLI
jgi:hypothetical protein